MRKFVWCILLLLFVVCATVSGGEPKKQKPSGDNVFGIFRGPVEIEVIVEIFEWKKQTKDANEKRLMIPKGLQPVVTVECRTTSGRPFFVKTTSAMQKIEVNGLVTVLGNGILHTEARMFLEYKGSASEMQTAIRGERGQRTVLSKSSDGNSERAFSITLFVNDDDDDEPKDKENKPKEPMAPKVFKGLSSLYSWNEFFVSLAIQLDETKVKSTVGRLKDSDHAVRFNAAMGLALMAQRGSDSDKEILIRNAVSPLIERIKLDRFETVRSQAIYALGDFFFKGTGVIFTDTIEYKSALNAVTHAEKMDKNAYVQQAVQVTLKKLRTPVFR